MALAYNLIGGSLAASTEYIGNSGSGAFTQTGGTNTVSNTLTLASNSGSSGTYNLQGGSLSAATVNLNAGGLFNQTGGSLNATTFNQQGGTVTGALENRGDLQLHQRHFQRPAAELRHGQPVRRRQYQLHRRERPAARLRHHPGHRLGPDPHPERPGPHQRSAP